MSALRKVAPVAVVTLALAVFLFNSLRQLQLPGFYYDEGFDLTPMLALLRGAQPELLRGIGLNGWPLMRMDYMGSLNGYLSLPFVAIFGYLGARIQPIFFSCVTMVLAFVLVRRWFGFGVALVTVGLLAVSPSFIWFTRQGITVTSSMTVLSLGAWLLLDVWRVRLRQPGSQYKRALLLCAGVLLGLGLWDKIIFLWWLVLTALIGGIWLICTPGLLRSTRNKVDSPISLRAMAPLMLGLVIGASPLIYFNVSGLLSGLGSPAVTLLFKSLLEPTQYGVRNSNFIANLVKRWQDFATFLNGSYFWYQANVPYGNVFSVPAFLISMVIGSLLATRRVEWRKWLALCACVAVYLPMSSFTVSDLWATHFFVLLPLPQMIVACASVWLAEWLASLVHIRSSMRVPVTGCALVALLAVPVSRDQWVNEQYHAALAQTGGSGRFSDAIYSLAGYFEQNRIGQPIALDWGIQANVEVVTRGAVRPVEIFGFTPQPDDAFRARAREALANPDNVYVLLWGGDEKWPGFAVFDRRKEFTRLAAEAGHHATEVFTAYERSGLPVYVVLKAD